MESERLLVFYHNTFFFLFGYFARLTATEPATNASIHNKSVDNECATQNDDLMSTATISMGNILENDEQIALPLTDDGNQSKKVFLLFIFLFILNLYYLFLNSVFFVSVEWNWCKNN